MSETRPTKRKERFSRQETLDNLVSQKTQRRQAFTEHHEALRVCVKNVCAMTPDASGVPYKDVYIQWYV